MAYQTPFERSRNGDPGGGNRPGPGQLEPPPSPGAGPDAYSDDAMPTPPESGAFEAPISALGGKTFKPGEEVVMKVVSIDQKAGTVMLEYATEEGGEKEESPGYQKAFDAAMPQEQG